MSIKFFVNNIFYNYIQFLINLNYTIMGILDRVFGNNSSDDDKFVIFLGVCSVLSTVDGEVTEDEVMRAAAHIAQSPGMTEERYNRIYNRFRSEESDQALAKAADLTDDEKWELLNLLIDIAVSDGYFHGEEASFICTLTVLIGLDHEHVSNHIFKEYNIDNKEFEVATKRLEERMREQGIIN